MLPALWSDDNNLNLEKDSVAPEYRFCVVCLIEVKT
jgi:hypothetical protein